MKRIILDYLRRWKWVYASGFVLHTILMTFAWMKEDRVIPAGILLGSAFHMMFDFIRSGGSRTVLTLPVTAKSVARAWRFLALEFPAAIYLVALILSAIIAALIEPTHLLNLERFVILVLFQTTFLGTIFYSLTGLPHSPAEQRHLKDQLRGAFFGLIWGFSIPGCFFLAQAIPPSFAALKTWQIFLLSCLAILTVAGWFRAELLVIKRAQQVSRVMPAKRSQPEKGERTSGDFTDRRFGGLPYYFAHVSQRTGLLGLAIVCLNWFLLRYFVGPNLHRNSVEFTASQVHFVIPIMTALAGIVALMQLRTFRSLPLSRFQVAGVLVLWPVAFGVVFGLIVVGLHRLFFGGDWIWSHYVGALIGASLLLLLVPMLLRLGFSLKSFLVMFLFFPLIQVPGIFEEQIGLRLANLWFLVLIFVPFVFVLTFRLLGTNYPWREGSLAMKRMFRR